ncbi:uncharacterized protein LOC123690833 [Colias croceus]|uniref:uncharacterized protein LOC123690833 n=1 Tax=Colias crocea TaxID=72248 RepID=UPI001E281335|nr:uncharacterized protein LOC123690833 [Colias croceus]
MNPNEKYTPFKEAKYCFVPSCKNNSIKHKEKMFFVVPSASKQDWCKALKEDITNYMYWSTMRGRPKLKASLPQSLQPNISPLREPQPSTSSAAIPMEIDSVTEIKILLCNKGVQVKPKMADRTTNCSLSKIKTAPSSFCHDDDDFNREQIDIDDAIPSTQGSTTTTTSVDVSDITNENIQKSFMLEIIEKRPLDYIGLPQNYYWLINFFESHLKLKSIHIIITLYKIKNNLSFRQISDMFCISLSTLWRIFYKALYLLSNFFKQLIFCPPILTVKRNLPSSFKTNKEYSNIYCIIDCFEIEIEKPSKPIEQSLTWSQYKNANTLKYLLASTPDGFIVFVSAGHGGRISDTNIVEVSRFLDVLPPNCSILADRGFKHIDTLLTKKGIKLLRPPSVIKNVKLTKKEAIQSKVIASLRIHIERVIRRIRLFKLLKPHSVINNKLIQYIDEEVIIACGLINLQSSIVKNC